MKRVFKGIGIIIILLVLGVVGMAIWLHQPYPSLKKTDPSEAKLVAQKMLAAVNDSAWQQTAVVAWSFKGMRNHIWDRQRNYAKVSWGNKEVLMRLHDQTGIAYKNGELLSGEEAKDALQDAWFWWCNDTFWLNPISKIFDQGTSLHFLEGVEQPHLFVQYSSGGITPGDSYLWLLDENYRPSSWKMWVNIIPIGGLEVTWSDWNTTSTGAILATKHTTVDVLSFDIQDLRTADKASQLTEGEEPFSLLK